MPSDALELLELLINEMTFKRDYLMTYGKCKMKTDQVGKNTKQG